MNVSGISNFGWIIVGLVSVLIVYLLYKASQKGKKIKTPLFEVGNEDEGKNIVVISNNAIQRSTVNGNVGDNIFIGTAPQVSPLQKQIYSLCIKVLNFAKEHHNMVSAKDLEKLCGDYSEAVYQMIDDEKVFYPIAGQRKIGIGKMKNKDICRLITKYQIELSKL